ncbi:MAG: CubicO group peptidase (beta-lactamase class C family) [Phycisphaerales bacterium]|jgi:CubicO group peptidase (beta-lactamase class C family)
MQYHRLALFIAWLSTSCATGLLQSAQPAAPAPPIPRTQTLPGIDNPAFPYALPESVGLDSAVLQGLADEVAHWVASGDLVGAELLIIKDGRTVLHESSGWSELDPKKPMSREQVISIKSMTKPITATAVLMLAEEGKLALTDPVKKHIPEFVGSDEVTIHHLLAQTSGDGGGHGGGGYNVYDFDTLEDWVVDWASQPLKGPPLGQFAYSNFNYAALGLIIERVSGLPCETFIQMRILDPLGMTESWTSFTPDAEWAGRVPGRFRQDPVNGGFERYWANTDEQKWKLFPAGFGIYCTTEDYARFVQSWLGPVDGGRSPLLSRETIDHALKPHGTVRGDPVYGYGWFIELDEDSGEPVLFRHGGHDGSVAMAFPKSNAMVLFMTHTEAGWHREALSGQIKMLGLFAHPGPAMVWATNHDVEIVPLTTTEHERLLGSYRSVEGGRGPAFDARVSDMGGHLRFELSPVGQSPSWWLDLVSIGEYRFHYGRYESDQLVGVDSQVEVRFVPQDDGSYSVHVFNRGELRDRMVPVHVDP